nr:RNA methyltransferase [Lutibaculum baratangense]
MTARQTRRPQRPRHDRRPAPPLEDHAIFGLHPVAHALRNPRRKRHKLLATTNALMRLKEMGVPIDVPVEEVIAGTLSRRLGGEAVHQGLLLECDPLPELSMRDLESADLLLVLDQVTDPHNVGAILRSAAAFAADAVIVTARHSPHETAVLAKSAAGALDVVPLVRVGNLARALEELNAMGVTTVGLAGEADSPLASLEVGGPLALVLGAEGKGLRQKTRETCTRLARIEMPGEMPSLNVSNAAAIALYAAEQLQRHGRPA